MSNLPLKKIVSFILFEIVIIALATASSAAVNANNVFHTEARILLLKCLKDPELRSNKYEVNISKAMVGFEDYPLSDADRLNGREYIGTMRLTYPFRSTDPGSEWRMGSWGFMVRYRNHHMYIIDSNMVLTGESVFFSVNACDEMKYMSAAARSKIDPAVPNSSETTPAAQAPQNDGAPPVASASQAAITYPDWDVKPTSADMEAYYPENARRLKISGKATIGCVVTAYGNLTDCSVVSEQPPDQGFGDAAVKMAPHFKMRPATRYGQPVGGAKIMIPLSFSPPGQ